MRLEVFPRFVRGNVLMFKREKNYWRARTIDITSTVPQASACVVGITCAKKVKWKLIYVTPHDFWKIFVLGLPLWYLWKALYCKIMQYICKNIHLAFRLKTLPWRWTAIARNCGWWMLLFVYLGVVCWKKAWFWTLHAFRPVFVCFVPAWAAWIS